MPIFDLPYAGKKAPYAALASKASNRLHAEPEAEGRSAFRRDCDRIIHSSAFRRLEYKTQVFVNHEGDHYRTRLTHSLEVAQIARSISRNLGLDEDLAEAISLAHDLGHTPFGHAGEDGLSAAMKNYGGFSHNAQTLKILTKLEQRYAEFDGLNLTWETLEGIAKHNGPLLGKYRSERYKKGDLPQSILDYNKKHDLALDKYPSLEAQVAALADDIAYCNHDLDDGIRAKLFTLKEIEALPLVGKIVAEVQGKYPKIQETRAVHEVIRRLIHRMIYDLLLATNAVLEKKKIRSIEDVQNAGEALVRFSAEVSEPCLVIRDFLMQRMYRHYRVNRMTSKARRMVQEIFTVLFNEPECLPCEWRTEAISAKDERSRAIIVADFIAGMTDRFAIEEHAKLFDMQRLS